MQINVIHQGDCRNMDNIDDESVHLTVGSPPYAVNKQYESYIKTFNDHLQLLCDAYKEVVRVTVPGGKIIVNIGDIVVGSRYNDGFPQELMVMPKLVDYLEDLDTYLYARIIWDKDDPWQNSSHVTFHDDVQHAEYRILPAWEYVFVFRKGRKPRRDKSATDGLFVDKYKWKKLVHGVWTIRSVQRNDYHEAMFPEKLVANCIELYSFPNDIVLDNWMGSGTVAAVAKKLGRNYIGYELNSKYVNMAEGRVSLINDNMIQVTPRYRDKTLNRHELQETLF
jgi:site-specific DNA-methyltransferase (adenine-specific)